MTSSFALLYRPPAPMTLRDALKYGTRSEHEALESSLDLMRPGFSLPDYHQLLLRYHAFYLAFETFLGRESRRGSLPARFYWTDRRKTPWLQQDLLALSQCEPMQNVQVFEPDLPVLFPTAEHQLGAIYVIEGSMLGGRILSRHFSGSLGLTVERGLRFFFGYGEEAARRWQATLQLLQDQDPGVDARMAVMTGAKRMFSLLDSHLAPSI